jgi:hypothetical protein
MYNKHKHAELISKWIEDTSQVVQYYSNCTSKWVECGPRIGWYETTTYRIKPKLVQKFLFAYLDFESGYPAVSSCYFKDESEFKNRFFRDTFKWVQRIDASAIETEEV